ncbi:unnamed protein product [Sphagnum jensenii]
MKHANVDALSRNPVEQAVDDDDLRQEIQDDPNIQNGMAEAAKRVLAVRYGQDLDWFGLRRQMRGLTEHRRCSFGINHWRSSDPHHLFMLDIVAKIDANEEATPNIEVMGAAENEELEVANGEQRLQKGQIKYYNRRQHIELVLVAQQLSEIRGHEVNPTVSGDEDKCGVEMKSFDIWQDTNCLALLKEGMLPDVIDLEEGKRAKKRVGNYCWKEQKLFFKDLYVPKPKERRPLVLQMHKDLGHSGEQRLLTEICRRYFWHS